MVRGTLFPYARPSQPAVASVARFAGRVAVLTFQIAAVLALAALLQQAVFGPWMILPRFVAGVIGYAAVSAAVLLTLVTPSRPPDD